MGRDMMLESVSRLFSEAKGRFGYTDREEVEWAYGEGLITQDEFRSFWIG